MFGSINLCENTSQPIWDIGVRAHGAFIIVNALLYSYNQLFYKLNAGKSIKWNVR